MPDSNSNETKTALLEAAKRLIRECGYTGASVRKLTAAAGTNLGAVNYHFGSREKLLNQALFESFSEWIDSIGEVSSRLTSINPNAGPLEHMAAQARPVLAEFPERLPLFVLALEALLEAQRSPELLSEMAAHYAELRRRSSEFIIAGTQGHYEPSPRDEPPPRMVEVAASFMIAVADGLMLQSLLDPEAIPTGDELAAFYEGLAAITRAGAPASTS